MIIFINYKNILNIFSIRVGVASLSSSISFFWNYKMIPNSLSSSSIEDERRRKKTKEDERRRKEVNAMLRCLRQSPSFGIFDSSISDYRESKIVFRQSLIDERLSSIHERKTHLIKRFKKKQKKRRHSQTDTTPTRSDE
uniref:Uncharacterized protein n=1 Tax=Pseudopediastrum sp. CL0201VA TaxID=2184484 RepID=A0A2U8GJQ4_9CHLO|nr:hypothetical protein [Pseudopediastrum sp. CL0201VA]AWI68904.1 hypothetical protein [Pseudopediastrum sp. CL0201VA]